jgi:hypothetical protein
MNSVSTKQQEDILGGVQRPALLELIKYLYQLADNLPQKEREEFLQSPARLEMKHLIDVLENGEI